MKRTFLTLIAVFAAGIPAIAGAQTFNQTSSRLVTPFIDPTTERDVPADTTVGPDGSRYLASTTNTAGYRTPYVAKFNVQGALVWSHKFPGAISADATAVALKGSDKVYLSYFDDGYPFTSHVVALNEGDGELLWDVETYDARLFDLLASESGVIVCGSVGGNAAIIEYSDADGSVVRSHEESLGSLQKMVRDSNGAIYGAGMVGYSPAILYWDPINDRADVHGASVLGGSGLLTDIAIHPETQTVMAVGSEAFDFGGSDFPVVSTLHEAWQEDHLVQQSSGWADFSYSTFGSTVDASSDGFYLALTGGFFQSMNVRRFNIDPETYSITEAWHDTINGSYGQLRPFDITFDSSNNPVVTALDGEWYGTGRNNFNGVHQFVYGKEGGAHLNRVRLGSKTESLYWIQQPVFSGLATFSNGIGHVYTSCGPDQAGQFITKDVTPIVYRTNEDTPFSIGKKRGLLNGAPNGFFLDGVTSENAVPNVGLSSVSIHPDGSFSAVPLPNFNGTASFQYEVKHDSTLISTRTATIKVVPVNDPPVAVDDTYSVSINSGQAVLDVLANDSDIDSAGIHVSAKSTHPGAVIGFSADRTSLTFKPKHGFSGTVTFEYTIRDSRGATSTATVSVTVS